MVINKIFFGLHFTIFSLYISVLMMYSSILIPKDSGSSLSKIHENNNFDTEFSINSESISSNDYQLIPVTEKSKQLEHLLSLRQKNIIEKTIKNMINAYPEFASLEELNLLKANNIENGRDDWNRVLSSIVIPYLKEIDVIKLYSFSTDLDCKEKIFSFSENEILLNLLRERDNPFHKKKKLTLEFVIFLFKEIENGFKIINDKITNPNEDFEDKLTIFLNYIESIATRCDCIKSIIGDKLMSSDFNFYDKAKWCCSKNLMPQGSDSENIESFGEKSLKECVKIAAFLKRWDI